MLKSQPQHCQPCIVWMILLSYIINIGIEDLLGFQHECTQKISAIVKNKQTPKFPVNKLHLSLLVIPDKESSSKHDSTCHHCRDKVSNKLMLPFTL